MKTLQEQLDSARRELALRRRNYPRWVKDGRLNPQKAEHEIQCIESIVATLEKMKMLAEASEEMKSQPSDS